jgi:hypothetical protein
MKQTCTYCGDEFMGEGIMQDEQVFCCPECLQANREETLDILDEDELEDII